MPAARKAGKNMQSPRSHSAGCGRLPPTNPSSPPWWRSTGPTRNTTGPCAPGNGAYRARRADQHARGQVDAWIIEPHGRFHPQLIAIALEHRRGALQVMLGKYEQLLSLSRASAHAGEISRGLVSWSRSKDDIKDADLLQEISTQHRDRLAAHRPRRHRDALAGSSSVENRRKLEDEDGPPCPTN